MKILKNQFVYFPRQTNKNRMQNIAVWAGIVKNNNRRPTTSAKIPWLSTWTIRKILDTAYNSRVQTSIVLKIGLSKSVGLQRLFA